jgi:hypothetical protein
MAQSREFIAALRLKLEADHALSAAKKAMSQLLGDAKDVETAFRNALESVQNKYDIQVGIDLDSDDMRGQIRALREAMIQSGLDKGLNLREVAQDADVAVAALSKVRDVTGQVDNQAEEIADAMHQAQLATEAYGKAAKNSGNAAAQAHTKTTLASQNVIRIVQDLPYGMMGITNNIQALGDSMTYLMNQVDDTTGKAYTLGGALKATFRGLLRGPMAVGLVITLISTLALQWDKVAAGVRSVGVALGITQRRFHEDAEAMKNSLKSLGEEFAENMSPEEARVAGEQMARIVRDMNREINELNGYGAAAGSGLRRFANGTLKLAMHSKELRPVIMALAGDFVMQAMALEDNEERLDTATGLLEALEKQASSGEARIAALAAELENLGDIGAEMAEKLAQTLFVGEFTENVNEFFREGFELDIDAIDDEFARTEAELQYRRQQRERELRGTRDELIGQARTLFERGVMTEAEFDAKKEQLETQYTNAVADLGTATERKIREAQENITDAAKDGWQAFEDQITNLQIAAMPDNLARRLAEVRQEYAELERTLRDEATNSDQLARGLAAAREARLVEEAEVIRTWNEEQRELQEKAIQQQKKVQDLQIQAQESYLSARTSMIADEHERERQELRDRERVRQRQLDADQASFEAQAALYEEGTDEYRTFQAQIAAIEARRIEIRRQTERAISDSHRDEAREIQQAAQKRADVLRDLAAEEQRLIQQRSELADNATWNPFGGFSGSFDAGQNLDEAGALDAFKNRWQQIQDAFADVDPGSDAFQQKLNAEAQAIEQHQQNLANIEEQWQQRRADAKRQFWTQSTEMIANVVSTISDIASMNYETWKAEREAELDALGVSEEEKKKIMEEEGAKRFEEQKKLQIAAAWAEGISGAVSAYAAAQTLGPVAGPIVGGINAALVMAMTAANVNRIKALRPGSGGGGSSAPSVSAGNYTALNAAVAADRVGGFETWRAAGGFNPTDPYGNAASRMENAVDRFEEAARNMTATVDPQGMGQIVTSGTDFNNLTNGNS